MLYLAEVKKQTRAFMGGHKTDLKLLACQHNDQTWSAVPGEEILSYDDANPMTEGTLLLVNLGNNRQLQGPPENAGGEIVRQLQKISRLIERGKEDQEKIEQWKQSLTYQSEILNRQKMEMEARLEQIEQMEAEFEYLERSREELASLKKSLDEQQRQLEEGRLKFGATLELSSEQSALVESLVKKLAVDKQPSHTPLPTIRAILEAMRSQGSTIEEHRRVLEEKKRALESRQREVDALAGDLERTRLEYRSRQEDLEKLRAQWQIQESVLINKQELLGKVNLTLQITEEAREMITRLARGDELEFEGKVDKAALERMPLGELEEIVNNLQKDLDRLVNFVNDQEEELTLQCEEVEELRAKLKTAPEYDRFNIEQELNEALERKGMLDETLVGQRRNLRERQGFLIQHIKVLKQRKGLLDLEATNKVDFEPVILMLAERHQSTLDEKRHLENEIDYLTGCLPGIREMIEQQIAEQEKNATELEEREKLWYSAKMEAGILGGRVELYGSLLQGFQDRLDSLRSLVDELSGWFSV